MASILTNFRLKLLGGFVARTSARTVALPTRKTEALLAFLALAETPLVRRDVLARLLWSAQGPEHARNNLRQALTALRHALGPGAEVLLRADRDAVALDPAAVTTDAHELARLAASNAAADLRRAAELYRGEFLAGFETLHAPAFEEWRAREAMRLQGAVVTALLALLTREEAAQVPASEEATSLARRLLEVDPLQEPAHRMLMRHYAARGQPGLALGQYEACRDLLAARLSAAPSPETERLRDELAGRSAFPVRAPATTLVHGHPSIPEAAAETRKVALPSGGPSLVVLPFANIGGDPGQEYFADGITEDLTIELSRSRWLSVVARGSAFAFKGQAAGVDEVGAALRVGYVLEGGVRKADERLRVTARLVNASTGVHLWGDRFDCALAGVFELQDEVVRQVSSAVESNVRRAEIGRALATPTTSLDAYDSYLRSLPHFYRLTRDGSGEALRILNSAAEADPGYARVRAYAGLFHALRFGMWWGHDREEATEAVRLAREALEIGSDDIEALRAAGYALGYTGRDHEAAVAALDRALLLGGGGSAPVLHMSGKVRYFAGDWRTAIDHLERAAVLSPLDPEIHYVLSGISMAHFVGGQYEAAAEYARRSIRLRPGWGTAHRQLVASLANLGQIDEARDACRSLLEVLPPNYSVATNRSRLPFRDATVTDRFLDGLRRAGVPE